MSILHWNIVFILFLAGYLKICVGDVLQLTLLCGIGTFVIWRDWCCKKWIRPHSQHMPKFYFGKKIIIRHKSAELTLEYGMAENVTLVNNIWGCQPVDRSDSRWHRDALPKPTLSMFSVDSEQSIVENVDLGTGTALGVATDMGMHPSFTGTDLRSLHLFVSSLGSFMRVGQA